MFGFLRSAGLLTPTQLNLVASSVAFSGIRHAVLLCTSTFNCTVLGLRKGINQVDIDQIVLSNDYQMIRNHAFSSGVAELATWYAL